MDVSRSGQIDVDATHGRRQIEANNFISLLGFSALLAADDLNPQDPETFSTIIRSSINNYGIEGGVLAKEFGVHISTLSRWSNGKSKPHKSFMIVIVDWIKDEVGRMIEKNIVDINDIDEMDKKIEGQIEKIRAVRVVA